MNKHLLLILLGFGLIGCSNNNIVSVSCGDNDDNDESLKATFNKASKEIDLELYTLGDTVYFLKSSIETPIDDDEIETIKISKLKITEYSYEFMWNIKYKDTALPNESPTEWYDRAVDLKTKTEYVFKLNRDDLKLKLFLNNEFEEEIQCKLIERKI